MIETIINTPPMANLQEKGSRSIQIPNKVANMGSVEKIMPVLSEEINFCPQLWNKKGKVVPKIPK